MVCRPPAQLRPRRDNWAELAFEGEPTRASTSRATATATELVVYGFIDGEPEVWTLPLTELG